VLSVSDDGARNGADACQPTEPHERLAGTEGGVAVGVVKRAQRKLHRALIVVACQRRYGSPAHDALLVTGGACQLFRDLVAADPSQHVGRRGSDHRGLVSERPC
jgi:hypothetical protein